MSDDLPQQLAEVIEDLTYMGRQMTPLHAQAVARLVLASGLVVPRAAYEDKLDLIRKLSEAFTRSETP